MTRRTWVLTACLACGIGVASLLGVGDSWAGIFRFGRSAPTRDLKEKLESQLRPRSPQEFAFLQRVVTLVEEKKLPSRLVEATFNWARKKRGPYRFPYFQWALKIEAAKRGIPLG